MSLQDQLIASENKNAKMEADIKTIIRTVITTAEMFGVTKDTFSSGVSMGSVMSLVPQIMLKVQMGSIDAAKMQELVSLGTIVKEYAYLVEDIPEVAEFFKAK